MGKLKLDLLKGIEEQEKAIDTSITNNKVSDIEPEPLRETVEEQVQMEQQQADSVTNPQSVRKSSPQTDKKTNKKKNEQKASEMTDKSSNEITGGISEKQPEGAGEFANEITADTLQEKNSKKKFINFDITDIDRYLTAVAGIHGKSKTKYLHDLVVADMKIHPEIAALIRN